MTIKLRPWQNDCVKKSLKWLIEDREDKHFVINAAPGSGKTITACVIADELLEKDEIDRVVVIAPRKKIASQLHCIVHFIAKKYRTNILSNRL